jgi:hypothetical protein
MTSGDARDGLGAPIMSSVPPDPPDSAAPAGTELDRLRAEVTALQSRLAARDHRRRRSFAIRRVVAAILVAVAGFGAVASAIGLWGARTTLDTDRWVATVSALPEQPAVTAAMSSYFTDEVFNVLEVRRRLADALPPRAEFLAAPVTGAVHDYMRDSVQRYMRSDDFQALWESANRFAHTQIMAVLENRSETVSVQGDTVTLNLLPIVNNLLTAIENALPTMFGRRLDLPTISAGEIPSGLRQRIETALGVTLPSDFAQIKFYNRHRLGGLQQAVVTFKRSVGLLIAGTVLALGLAFWVSPNRRRTILQLGLWLTIAVFVLSYAMRAIRDQLLAMVPNGLYREGVSVAVHEMFTGLRQWGGWILWTGVAVAVLAYLLGPGRFPVTLRRGVVRGAGSMARTTRTIATGTELRRWSARHLDVLRVGGVAVAAIAALLFSSWTALLVIIMVLTGYEVLVAVLARWGEQSAPPPPPPAAAAAAARPPVTSAGTQPGQT